MKSVFNKEVAQEFIERINKLNPSTQALWGKMNVSQMLAHCNVAYEMIYENIHTPPNGFKKFILKLLVKNLIVSEKPYKQSMHTAPQFIITEVKDFEKEKTRLINYINKTQELGEKHFEGLVSTSFGSLTANEWNNMLSKHLNHHLSQFGV